MKDVMQPVTGPVDMLGSDVYMNCVEEFLSRTEKWLKGLDVYECSLTSDWFFPLQRRAELAKMMQVARRYSPRVIYEIGADKGAGIWHWCMSQSPTIEKVIACEVRGTPYAALMEKAFPKIQFLWLEESSYSLSAITKVREFLGGEKVDVLFIDGDKNGFEKDFYSYLGVMARPGVVFMHDVNEGAMSGPGRAFTTCSIDHRSEKIIDVSDADAAIEREKAGIPIDCPYEGWLRHWRGRSCGVGCIYLD